MVNIPAWIPACESHNPGLLDLFISSGTSICLTMVFPPLEISDHVFVSVSIDFPSHSKQDILFHGIVYDYYCTDWGGLCDPFRDVPWEDIFKFSVSAAAREFREWVQVGINAYIAHCKYQVKPHLSP